MHEDSTPTAAGQPGDNDLHCCECAAKWRDAMAANDRKNWENLERHWRDDEVKNETDRLEIVTEAAVEVIKENKAGDELSAASSFLTALFKAEEAKVATPRADWKLPGR